MSIDRLPSWDRYVPCRVMALHLGMETDLLRYGQAQRRVVDLNVAGQCRQIKPIVKSVILMVGNHLFYVNWRRNEIPVGLLRINHFCGTQVVEPKPPIRCFGRDGLISGLVSGSL